MGLTTKIEHHRKEYKENVKYTEEWQGWLIEIEHDVLLAPPWFDPEVDDHLELEDIELEKGFNFYITNKKTSKTYKSLWSFRTSGNAYNTAKRAIMEYENRRITHNISRGFYRDQERNKMQPNDQAFREIREWESTHYQNISEPQTTETYHGFTIQIREVCQYREDNHPERGLKFYIITPKDKIYTNGYIYHGPNANCQTLNTAYEAIDNGEIPDDKE